ncbi:MAG: intradiol ring-cleavage dioxygenase [Caldimonas sp.]
MQAAACRRMLMRGVGAIGLASLQLPALARVLGSPLPAAPAATPRLTDGPFYPVAFEPSPTTTLIIGALTAQAVPMRLVGRVVDRSGRAVAGSRVEIWQCDANRHYRHPADSAAQELDRGFAGFGWQPSGADGGYRFETIRPVPYPGRTPHIHVKVKVDGRAVLSSQIFMPDRVLSNQRDFLWRELGREAQPLALATLGSDGPREVAQFDIVLD